MFQAQTKSVTFVNLPGVYRKNFLSKQASIFFIRFFLYIYPAFEFKITLRLNSLSSTEPSCPSLSQFSEYLEKRNAAISQYQCRCAWIRTWIKDFEVNCSCACCLVVPPAGWIIMATSCMTFWQHHDKSWRDIRRHDARQSMLWIINLKVP